jgi:hypothetical protein
MFPRLVSPLFLLPALMMLSILMLSGRRRPVAPLPGLFLPPLPVDAPALMPPIPAPERFYAVPAGESMLLRVHIDQAVEQSETMLILDHDDELDVLHPLDGPSDHGAIGFRLPGRSIAEGARFWLEVSGRIVSLGSPEVLAV